MPMTRLSDLIQGDRGNKVENADDDRIGNMIGRK